MTLHDEEIDQEQGRRQPRTDRNALYIGLFLLFVIVMAVTTFTPNAPAP